MGRRGAARSASPTLLGLEPPIDEWVQEEAVEPEMLEERVRGRGRRGDRRDKAARARRRDRGRRSRRAILLQNLDHHWKEHLATLDALRQVVHLRAYAQKTPINEYKQEAFALFERMLGSIREDVTRTLALRRSSSCSRRPSCPSCPTSSPRISIRSPATTIAATGDAGALRAGHDAAAAAADPAARRATMSATDPAEWEGRVSRNAPCPCGSGRKYKHCHGAV